MCADWDEDEHTRLAEFESFFDFPTHMPVDSTTDSGYGNAERSFRSQEVRNVGSVVLCI